MYNISTVSNVSVKVVNKIALKKKEKEGLLIILLPSIPGSTHCPATALLHFFSLVPASPSAPLFCLPATSGYRPITFATFSTCLKRLISTIGLDPAHYSPHSFRRGGATFAFQSGVPEHLMKLHGDWRSDAFRAYLALPLETRSQVADVMAAGLLSTTDNVSEQCAQPIAFCVLSPHQPFTQNF